MKNCKIDWQATFLLAITLLFAYASPAFSNPIVTTKSTVIAMSLILTAILAEIAVTLLLLKRYKLKLFRLAGAYLIVNVVSFLIFIAMLLLKFRSGGLMFPIPEMLAEALVIIFETIMLIILCNMRWFRYEDSSNCNPAWVLFAVICGNVTSIALPLLLIPLRFAF